jgi:cellulose synthase/poly-beta-1,6-N-acetylglucosamine synthase-like glycosyltransferase
VRGRPFVELAPGPSGSDPVDPLAAALISPETARVLGIVPIADDGQRVVLAIPNPDDDACASVVSALTGRDVATVVATPDDIGAALDRLEGKGVQRAEPSRRLLLGELLVERGLVTEQELDDALQLQQRYGDRLGEILMHTGVVMEDDLMDVLAEQLRLTFADQAALSPDAQALALVPEPVAREHRVAPLAVVDGTLWVAMTDAHDKVALALLEEHSGMPLRTVVASDTAIDSLLQRSYSNDYALHASRNLLERAPEESAHYVLSRRQRWFMIGLLAIGATLLAIAPITTVVIFNVATVAFYTLFTAYRFTLVYRSLAHDLELPVTDEDLAALDERDLPIYTILVPLYREAAVLPRLIESIAAIDYPPTRLDVKLLLEADDDETIEALDRLDVPPHFKRVIVPQNAPKTKPKACNYGLRQARGEYVVIYDAEDRPEPDQLKKVAAAFAKAGDWLGCIQCKLNYFNRDQNLLTKWFTTEYSMWFDLFMPGLDAGDSPIPLGGTSNHFPTALLVKLGSWDPFNVTEDADLGIRLHKSGYRTAIVDSTTYEEANSNLGNWIRQRSRWVKGYIQTWLVQMRHPCRLLGQLGVRRFLSFQLVYGGTFAVFLLNPIYWILTATWMLTEAGVIESAFPGPVYYAAAFSLHVGNFAFAFITAAGSAHRGYYELVKYAFLSPIYWALMSIGAWKGLIQLFTKPFYWEKTVHGLDPDTALANAR